MSVSQQEMSDGPYLFQREHLAVIITPLSSFAMIVEHSYLLPGAVAFIMDLRVSNMRLQWPEVAEQV